jgi:hypothetical protein
MGMICNTVGITSITMRRVWFPNLIHDPSLCRILAYPVHGGSISPRHRHIKDVCPQLLPNRFENANYIPRRLADLTDLDLVFANPDATLFPGITDDVQVHEGFMDEHKKTAALILAEVNRLLSVHRSTNVVVVCP